jgi:hypothetical protein
MSGSRYALGVLVLGAMLAALGCSGGDGDGGGSSGGEAVIDPGDGGNYEVTLEPANFVERIDHPFLPFTPGSRWVYESDDGSERIEVEVLAETREILGISATIVRDTVTEDGEVVEDTYDWYAQDAAGNVWYLGEDSTEFEDGEAVSTAGSWEAGVDGALPGIVMLAEPTVGQAYRQEFYAGEAEDLAEVMATDAEESVAFGASGELLRIQEWTPLEPDVVEDKYYARGVGVVLEVVVEGGEGRVGLVSYEPGE